LALVHQVPLPDGLALDAFTLEQDGLPSAEVNISRGEVLQALVVALVVIVLDKGLDLRLEVAGQVVVLKRDAVLECLVPALGLALGLWVGGRSTDILDALFVQPFG
jgi:hypothetical protein